MKKQSIPILSLSLFLVLTSSFRSVVPATAPSARTEKPLLQQFNPMIYAFSPSGVYDYSGYPGQTSTWEIFWMQENAAPYDWSIEKLSGQVDAALDPADLNPTDDTVYFTFTSATGTKGVSGEFRVRVEYTDYLNNTVVLYKNITVIF